LNKFCVKFDSVWAKIKLLHPQKHSISFGYGFQGINQLRIYQIGPWSAGKDTF